MCTRQTDSSGALIVISCRDVTGPFELISLVCFLSPAGELQGRRETARFQLRLFVGAPFPLLGPDQEFRNTVFCAPGIEWHGSIEVQCGHSVQDRPEILE